MIHPSVSATRRLVLLSLAVGALLAPSAPLVAQEEEERFHPYAFSYGGEEEELWNDTFDMCTVREKGLLASLDSLQRSRNTKRRWYGGAGLVLSTLSAVLSAVDRNPEWAIGFSVLAGAASVPTFVTSGDQEARQELLAHLAPLRERRAAVLQATATLSRSYADLDARCRAAAAEGATKQALVVVGCESDVSTLPDTADPVEALRHVVESKQRYLSAWGDVEAGLFQMREACAVR